MTVGGSYASGDASIGVGVGMLKCLDDEKCLARTRGCDACGEKIMDELDHSTRLQRVSIY